MVISMEQNRFYLWGAGGVGKRAAAYLATLADFVGVIDNDVSKHGETLCGLPICSYESAKPYLSNSIVVIAHFSPRSTEEVLRRDGFYSMRLSEFIAHLFWERNSQNALGFLDFPITMRCTLNCRDCMQRVPLRKNKDVPVETLIDDLGALFRSVSFVGEISIIGGEPFVHSDFLQLLTHIVNNYREQIGSLVITTNGTVIPPKDVLDLCRDNGIFISISDYGKTLPSIIPKLEKLEETARASGVSNERKRWSWSDPGCFDSECGINECTLEHMQLYGGRLWRCTFMAAGTYAGLCTAVESKDYYDLYTGNRKELHNFLSAGKLTTQCHKCRYPLEIGIESAVQEMR